MTADPLRAAAMRLAGWSDAGEEGQRRPTDDMTTTASAPSASAGGVTPHRSEPTGSGVAADDAMTAAARRMAARAGLSPGVLPAAATAAVRATQRGAPVAAATDHSAVPAGAAAAPPRGHSAVRAHCGAVDRDAGGATGRRDPLEAAARRMASRAEAGATRPDSGSACGSAAGAAAAARRAGGGAAAAATPVDVVVTRPDAGSACGSAAGAAAAARGVDSGAAAAAAPADAGGVPAVPWRASWEVMASDAAAAGGGGGGSSSAAATSATASTTVDVAASAAPTAASVRAPAGASAAAADDGGGRTRVGATGVGAADDATSGDDDDTSSGSDDEDDSVGSDDGTVGDEASDFSVDCVTCDRHIRRDQDGTRCEDAACRRTRCTTCAPAPAMAPAWWCDVHAAERAEAGRSGAAAAAAAAVEVPAPGTIRVLGLPPLLSQRGVAAATSIAHALTVLGPDWREDGDLAGMADDLADTLGFGPASSNAKGKSAVRRLEEFVTWLPRRLSSATATAEVVDVVLAMFVNARCGVATASPWQPPTPDPPTVRGEVNAIVGLLRLAGLLPADPKGTIPRTRRAMRKCGCTDKLDASPRAYTFAWELTVAWLRTVDRSDPREVAVWCCCAVALSLLLRPKYVRRVTPADITSCQPQAPDTWILRWKRDDKARPAARPAGAPGLREAPASGLPAKHPRLSASAAAALNVAMHVMGGMRPAGVDSGPIFRRVERARQGAVVPKGAVPFTWHPPVAHGHAPKEPVPAYWWPGTGLSSGVIKRHLVRFLTPIIGAARARLRVLSGMRGGGEMELKLIGAPPEVRATIGWWVVRLLKAEGAIVTYDGCSVEAMASWTRRLGDEYLRVLAPGVHTTTPPAVTARAARARHVQFRTVAALDARARAAAGRPRPGGTM